ncbi:MAG: CbiX/SirB N-terminal domain-containing protein [Chloroflexota bacterium]
MAKLESNLLVIVGYGAVGQGYNPELDVLATTLSRQLAIPVRTAFLEASSPSVGESIQDGIADNQPGQIIVLPLFLGASAAQKNTVGLILDAAYDRWPEIAVQEAKAPAAHPGIIAAYRELLTAAISSVPQNDLGDTALLVVGRGSRDADSNAHVYQMARLIWENSGLGSLETAFYGKTQPDIPAAIQRCVQSGARRIVILPYVLYERGLYDAIQARFRQAQTLYPDVEMIVTLHLGIHNGIIKAVSQRYQEALAEISGGVRRVIQPHSHGTGSVHAHGIVGQTVGIQAILPPRYQADVPVSAAPMGAADLVYGADGQVAWDQIWGSFCDLALAGGPPHRGTLLEPVAPHMTLPEQERYQQVLAELARGIQMITMLPVIASTSPGWIGVQCSDEAMALWLLRAIIVENVSVRREGAVLYLPAGPDFRLEHEIKNVITVIAKTHHYWTEHLNNPNSSL